MKDLRERLEKLRDEAASLDLMSRRTSDAGKQELFRRLAEELAIEALELELAIGRQSANSDSIEPEKVVPLRTRSKRE
ncbi:hypothetical protein [Bradyrhizobium sp. CB1015]|uniref:hypothetical protein n=1 Tax=Bradyrhizobium sp. CB1015 TaxID=2976822 RepID=UPI0021AA4B8C|nr:hypothetical protein [Bradyrhizobium sp. CB1015]UWU93220.1 hypothetical protein N2604_04460 [Bradyrhizobium sp. CB1015]